MKDAELAVAVGIIERQQKELESSADLVRVVLAPATNAECCSLIVVNLIDCSSFN